ncbi:VOC family protein [Brevibacillus daliensis]|uniref:VOC family protein n=1 Tax=Brevibacillus daliensis TaxID=2892995 RepID=UPI001E453CA8|nr:VOC family protein [Brevibacillus daliensis]
MKEYVNFEGVFRFYLPVQDRQKAKEWYCNHLGMKLHQEEEQHVILSLLTGPTLQLFQCENVNQYSVAPFMIKTVDGKACHKRLTENSVETTPVEEFYHYWCFSLIDPDGNPIEITGEQLEGYKDNDMIIMQGNFFAVSNLERTLAWYEKHFGADVEYDFTMNSLVATNTRAVTFHNLPISLVESPISQLVHRQCTIRTTNIEADYEHLKGSGVEVTELYETTEGNRMFCYIDPDGYEIGVCQPTWVNRK